MSKYDIDYVKSIFIGIASKHTFDLQIINKVSIDIVRRYALRPFHTYKHICDILVKSYMYSDDKLVNDNFIMAVILHDVVYDVIATDNEEQSAFYANIVLPQLGFSKEDIDIVSELILFTKHYTDSKNVDYENLPLIEKQKHFLKDLDLSGLGDKSYNSKLIMKEFEIYDDFIRLEGRLDFLQTVVSMERIFTTDLCFEKYEETARQNLIKEINQIKSELDEKKEVARGKAFKYNQ